MGCKSAGSLSLSCILLFGGISQFVDFLQLGLLHAAVIGAICDAWCA